MAGIALCIFRLSDPHPGFSEMQADYSFAEWWILAQAEWLIMLYPSAYSTTAAEVGFGTAGLSAPACALPFFTSFPLGGSSIWRIAPFR